MTCCHDYNEVFHLENYKNTFTNAISNAMQKFNFFKGIDILTKYFQLSTQNNKTQVILIIKTLAGQTIWLRQLK